MTEDAAIRPGRLIRERRKALELTQADVQAAGGPSTATLRLVEGGKHTDFRPSTIQPLEKALHWGPGSIAILQGGGPSVSGVIREQAGRTLETFTRSKVMNKRICGAYSLARSSRTHANWSIRNRAR